MDTKNLNLELAIQKLLEERNNRRKLGNGYIEDDDDDRIFLSRLLSQLESLKKDEKAIEQPEVSKEPSEVNTSEKSESKIEKADQSDGSIDVETEKIVKELKEVKKQNTITHWLLSIMIFLTVAWQISEVSFLMKVKNGLDHPFRFLGGMFTGMLRIPIMNADEDEENQNQLLEATSLPSIKMPDLPHVDLSELISNEDED